MKIKSLTIFCSSSDLLNIDYYYMASEIGNFLGNKKISIIYGGGNTGLMGKVANSALNSGSKVIGIMPEILANKERINYDITETIIVKSMSERKKILYERGDAFLILPGGSGTIEEASEIISWKNLGIHNKQIIIFNYKNYWDPLFKMFDNIKKNKFGDKNLQSICKTVKTLQEFSLLFK